MERTVVGLWEHREHAEQAARALEASGIAKSNIQLLTEGGNEKDLWPYIKMVMIGDDRAEEYAEGLRRGATLLSVRTTSENEPNITAIMKRFNVIDIDERSAEWRAGGWAPNRAEPEMG